MKLIIITILALAVLVSSNPVKNELFLKFVEKEEWHPSQTYFMVEKSPGVYEKEDLLYSKIQLTASEDDATIFFYSRNNPEDPIELSIYDASSLVSDVHYNNTKPHVFISHGWNNNYQSNVNVLIKASLLEKYDVNVFVVDWSGPANKNYITARNAVTAIGEGVGDFINSLREATTVNLSDITLIGHSLGAHVVGGAGARVNGLVGTIIGLDPAYPLVIYDHLDARLDTTDGEFVQVIHTCAGFLGMKKVVGHVDYFPNGGSAQPGCFLDLAGSCSHGRSFEFYAESILDNKFVSVECKDEFYFKVNKCNNNLRSLMGGYMDQIDKEANGTFYLNTNDEEPWGLGDIYSSL
ncbi:unnamed protein product [Brassicogethes aeneus]|uniref:Lipase domain-containing protein n=1 Tax=Brassicogethes aeneus TaxID=1431903 RepID=A0A9P0FMN2_BRAAE|nr:unnamed protein product [Brassicogethes aeneus]